ncbi:MAG: phosphopantothenoylcysteine decarboxylase [Planctomycetes bacterium]|nr:phosphopantothenoylcysteine decarboxylase [Planctomycetota bacterium]MCB9909628.1 phosphopantothenoylcysteine decarboxylase [Planctomycetota bacterium]MCB9911883.1 phosphopantothenoylcysteine decarboxylase [Planctomycetota bacterium]HPF14623.1 phosphopantothenoylcysteine decarboxylase [Planctomycetota bacterium]
MKAVSKRALNLVITAGPTREYIDPVRYLSNESSGKMGFAIAAAAVARGHKVTLIAGPVHLETPAGVERIDVVSAREMLAALKEAFLPADGLIMAAAVADYRPARRLAGKWKKKSGPRDTRISLDLVENPDLLATVGRRKGPRRIMGFALETSDGRRRALEKMLRKNADCIALNGASALNADRTSVTLLARDGREQLFANQTKAQVAKVLVRVMEELCVSPIGEA